MRKTQRLVAQSSCPDEASETLEQQSKLPLQRSGSEFEIRNRVDPACYN